MNDDRTATAYHEAGHACAYYRHGLPLEYVTIEPEEGELRGLCQPPAPRLIDVGVAAVIAAAGPVAQAIWQHDAATDDERAEYDDDWRNVLLGAVLDGGHDDAEQSLSLLDDRAADVIREWMLHEWPAVAELAQLLTKHGTVHAPQLRAVLGGTTRRRGPGR